ncbi:hypothetical protein DRN74_03030 [Candidatus Micrarchaeota archaeon]|nr:MAG: hypothetical protein DRN74_03030 [Candidatus Micrarchaeota archaeon]
MKERKLKEKMKLWAAVFALWLLALVLFMSLSGAREALLKIEHLNPFFLLAAVFFVFMSPYIYALNLKLLLHFLGGKISFLKMFKITLAGFFVDNVLPNIAPGGEFTIAYLMHEKAGVEYSKAFATVVAQIVSWFFGFSIFAITVILSVVIKGAYDFTLLVIIMVLFALFAFSLLIIIYLIVDLNMCRKLVVKGARFAAKIAYYITKKENFKPELLGAWADKTVLNFHTSVIPLLHKKKIIVNGLLMSFQHFFVSMAFFMVMLASGIFIPVYTAMFIYLAVTMTSLLSLLPGGIGVFEIVSISFMSMGAGLVDGTLFTTIFRLISYWLIVFVGAIVTLKMGLETLIENEEFKL